MIGLTCCSHPRHEDEWDDRAGSRVICLNCGTTWTGEEYDNCIDEERRETEREDDFYRFGRDELDIPHVRQAYVGDDDEESVESEYGTFGGTGSW